MKAIKPVVFAVVAVVVFSVVWIELHYDPFVQQTERVVAYTFRTVYWVLAAGVFAGTYAAVRKLTKRTQRS